MIDLPLPPQHYETTIQEHRGSDWQFPVRLPPIRYVQSIYAQQECYFDMGGLGSSIWNFIHWVQPSPDEGYEEFDTDAFSQYLTSLFTQMKTAGMDQIELSFAQLCDIDAYAAGDFSKISSNDIIGVLLEQMVTSDVHFPEGTNLLSLITETAAQQRMKTALSFGGENAAPADFTLCQSGETPEGQAQKLVDIMQQYNISSVDFDVEGASALALGQEEGITTFFSTLYQALAAQGKTATLTIQGSLTQTVWGTGTPAQGPSSYNGPLKSLFYNADNEPIFSSLFSGVNLMLYDNGSKYYLDAKVYPDDTVIPDWCVEEWLDIVGSDNDPIV